MYVVGKPNFFPTCYDDNLISLFFSWLAAFTKNITLWSKTFETTVIEAGPPILIFSHSWRD